MRVGLLGVVGAVGLGCAGVGAPTRVVVVRAGEIDARQEYRVAAAVAKQLQTFGFRVVVAPDALPADGDLEDAARGVAADEDAASAVVLRFSHRDERAGVVPGTRQHAVRLEAVVVSGDAGHPPVRDAWEFSAEDYTPGAVEGHVVDAWADLASPFAVEHLYTTPPVAEVLTGQPSLDDLEAATELRSREGLVGRRSERASGYATWCGVERDRVAALAAAEGSTCPGDPCVQRTLLGIDPQGRAIVQDLPRVPIFTIPPRDSAYWFEPPEELLAVAPDGAETPLLRANNLYGYGDVVPGSDVGGVEWFGVGGVNAVVAFGLADGALRTVSILREGEESAFSRASASGVLVCLQHGGGCFTDAGAGRVAAPAFDRADWVDLGAGPVVVGSVDDAVAVHVPGEETRTGDRVPGLTHVLGAHGGALLVLTGSDRGECALVTLAPATLEVATRTPMPTCLGFPSVAPDGTLLGIGRIASDPEGDVEVVSWDPGTGTLRARTQGGFEEEAPAVGADGRIWFSRLLEASPPEYDTRQYRRVTCTLPPG